MSCNSAVLQSSGVSKEARPRLTPAPLSAASRHDVGGIQVGVQGLCQRLDGAVSGIDLPVLNVADGGRANACTLSDFGHREAEEVTPHRQGVEGAVEDGHRLVGGDGRESFVLSACLVDEGSVNAALGGVGQSLVFSGCQDDHIGACGGDGVVHFASPSVVGFASMGNADDDHVALDLEKGAPVSVAQAVFGPAFEFLRVTLSRFAEELQLFDDGLTIFGRHLSEVFQGGSGEGDLHRSVRCLALFHYLIADQLASCLRPYSVTSGGVL